MSNREDVCEIRPLDARELDAVSGGVIAHLHAAVIAAVIGGWDIAPGATLKDAATALGMSHLVD